jgi:hypothetical protein
MYRPPLTRLEVEAVLRRDVKHYMLLGATKAKAIDQVATEHGLDREWVAQLVDGLPGGEA